MSNNENNKFKNIDVERLNIIEKDGLLIVLTDSGTMSSGES